MNVGCTFTATFTGTAAASPRRSGAGRQWPGGFCALCFAPKAEVAKCCAPVGAGTSVDELEDVTSLGRAIAKAEDATDVRAEIAAARRSVLDVRDYGADPTGTNDSAPGILAAVTAALAKNNLGRPDNAVYVPPGIYRLSTSLDFSTIALPAGYPVHIDGFQFICDASAILYVSLTNAPAVNIKPPVGHEFRNAVIVVGGVYDDADHANVIGVRLESISNSRIMIDRVDGVTQAGVQAAPSTTVGVFNNVIDVRMIRECNIGFEAKGNLLPNVYGFPGNQVHLGQVAVNNVGIINGGAVADSTQWNSYTVGAVENNAGWGIIDYSGQTEWHIINENLNASGAFILAGGAVGRPIIEGHLDGAVELSGGKATTVTNANDVPINSVVAVTTDTGPPTAATAVPGLSTTIKSPGAWAEIEALVSIDLSSTGGGAIYIGEVTVDGVPATGELIFQSDGGMRCPVTKRWRLSSLAKGNHTIAFRHHRTSEASDFTANGKHSTMAVTRK